MNLYLFHSQTNREYYYVRASNDTYAVSDLIRHFEQKEHDEHYDNMQYELCLDMPEHCSSHYAHTLRLWQNATINQLPEDYTMTNLGSGYIIEGNK